MQNPDKHHPARKPDWFKIKAPLGARYREVKGLLNSLGLHTVCQEANCPNRAECYGAGTATFLILGDTCTRGCTFCNVRRGRPEQPDREEPERVARAVQKLALNYAVVTSVTRDDLSDGGASAFADTINSIRAINPQCRVEVLIPDFQGDFAALKIVLEALPDVLNHNLETVRRLYPEVRRGADYDRSLSLFENVRAYRSDIPCKSGLMLGLGETADEIQETLADLHRVGCRLLTIGQYLPPSNSHHPLVSYYTPEQFAELAGRAYEMGFKGVVSGPLIRSSYQASRMYSGGRISDRN